MVGDSWEITLKGHTVRFETERLASYGKSGQNDIIGKLESPEDQAIVDSWRGKDLLTEKSPCSGIENLTAHATKLGGPEPTVPPVEEPPSKEETRSFYEEIAREQAQLELYVREREQRESLERMEAAGYQRIRGFLAKPLGDGWIELALEEFYKEAQLRVSSGFQDNYVENCHLITGGQTREVKSLPDLDSLAGVQVHVKLLKPRLRIDYNAPVIDQPAPAVPGVEAPAEEAVEAPAVAAVPAVEAPEAPVAPAEAAPEAAEGSEALDEGTAEQAETAEEAAENSEIEVVEGLKVRRKEDSWLELAARTLDEYKNDLEILAVKVADGTVKSCRMKHAKGWANELYQVNFKTGKLYVPKGKKSVEADLARVQICLADD